MSRPTSATCFARAMVGLMIWSLIQGIDTFSFLTITLPAVAICYYSILVLLCALGTAFDMCCTFGMES